MRHAREIIRLKFSCVSTHEIARRLGMACSTVRETLKRTETAGLSWPLPEDMSEGARGGALRQPAQQTGRQASTRRLRRATRALRTDRVRASCRASRYAMARAQMRPDSPA